MNKEEIKERIKHLRSLLKYLKTQPIFDENKIPNFKKELRYLKGDENNETIN